MDLPAQALSEPLTACVQQAASAYGADPAAVVREIALRGGRSGEVRSLPGGEYEVGLMRIPSSAIPALTHYGVEVDQLAQNDCLNIQVGTYMLRIRELTIAQSVGPALPPAVVTTMPRSGNAERDACMVRAATNYQLPLLLLRAIERAEGGTMGQVSRNKNGSVDMGLMQINSVHLHSPPHSLVAKGYTREQLINDTCVNISVAAMILRHEIDGAAPDFWLGVSRYHSKTQTLGRTYLARVVGHLQTLMAGGSK